MCEYCNTKSNKKIIQRENWEDGFIRSNINTFISGNILFSSYMCNHGVSDGTGAKINYCPMCGRKLD